MTEIQILNYKFHGLDLDLDLYSEIEWLLIKWNEKYAKFTGETYIAWEPNNIARERNIYVFLLHITWLGP